MNTKMIGKGGKMDVNDTNDFWYSDDVRPYIIKYLKERFSDSIIRQESNFVDITVLRELGSVPVEIQSVRVSNGKITSCSFEDRTRRQVEENIDISGICFLFLDAKFLEHLKNTSSKYISLNMKWLYEYYKQEKVKVFSITKSGIIKELKDDDLNILTKFNISYLDRNRSRIEYNLLKWKKFTTDEINDIYKLFKEKNKKNLKYDAFTSWLLRKEANNREKEYGYICLSLGYLDHIDEILRCSSTKDHLGFYLHICEKIGIIYRNGHPNNNSTRIYIVNEPNILQFFDGYLENKELWDYLKNHPIDNRTFKTIIIGEYPKFLKERKNQKNIEDAWNYK